MSAFAPGPDTGLIVTGSALASVHRDLIIKLVARHKLPAVISNAISSTPAGWSPMVLTSWSSTARQPPTSIAS